MDKIGLIKYNVSNLSVEDFFRWCRENGVEYVELMRDDVWQDVTKQEFKIKEVSMLLDKYGIKVSQISAGNDFLQKSMEDFKKQVELVATMCRIVKDLGFNQIRMDGGWEKQGIEKKDYHRLILDGIKRSVDIAEKEGVYLALDNHGKVTNDYLFQLEIFDSVRSKYLGANLDTMNYRWYGYSVEELLGIYKKIVPYTLHTHLKDGVLIDSFKYAAKVLGEGEIPIVETIKMLKDAGYKGPWCIEYEGKDGIEGYKKSVEWLKKIKV